MKTALIVGSTGLVGKYVVEYLLDNPKVEQVISLVRKPSGMQHSKLNEIIIDFDNLDQYASQFKADTLFCCLGTTIKAAGSQEAFKKVDYEYPIKVAEICKQNGTQHMLIITALGADKNSGIFYNKVKGETEETLKTLDFEQLDILQPSLLIGERDEFRLGENIAQKVMPLFDGLMFGSLKKYKSITGKQVAKAMVEIALQNNKGIHYHLSDELQGY